MPLLAFAVTVALPRHGCGIQRDGDVASQKPFIKALHDRRNR